MSKQNAIDLFITQKGECFSDMDLSDVKAKLAVMDNNRVQLVTSLEYKKPMIMLLISIFLGYLGVDRFMLGQTMYGAIKLLTAGGCGVWWLIDLFLIGDLTKKANYDKFIEIAGH